jgi:hypothetical protein
MKLYASCLGWTFVLGGHNNTPVKHKQMLFPPACSSPLITEDLLGSWAGRYIRMGMDSPEQHSLYSSTACLA